MTGASDAVAIVCLGIRCALGGERSRITRLTAGRSAVELRGLVGGGRPFLGGLPPGSWARSPMRDNDYDK